MANASAAPKCWSTTRRSLVAKAIFTVIAFSLVLSISRRCRTTLSRPPVVDGYVWRRLVLAVFHQHICQVEQGLPRAAIADPKTLVAADEVVLRKARAQQRHAETARVFDRVRIADDEL